MSLSKTASACVLLALLATGANGQTLRPPTTRQYRSSANSGRPAQTQANRSLMSAGPAAPRTIAYDSPESGETDEVWTSDAPQFETADADAAVPQPDAYNDNADAYNDNADAYNDGEAPPDQWNGPGAPPEQFSPRQRPHSPPDYSQGGFDDSADLPDPMCAGGYCNGINCPGGACGGANCSDGSCACGDSAAASSWLGAYRFGGAVTGYSGAWYLSADAFLMHRSNGNAHFGAIGQTSGSGRAITVDSNTGNTVLSVQDLKFTSKVGPRLMVGYAWSHTTAFELSYWGLIDSRVTQTHFGNSNLSVPGDFALSPLAPDFFDASQAGASYSSRVNNAEFNVLRNTGYSPISWLYGFRYLGWNEYLDITSVGSSGTGTYNINTRNNMYGIQGGARWVLNMDRFALETTAKVGVLENATQQRQTASDTATAFMLRDTLTKGSNVSFLGELGVNGLYRINEHWGLRGGYTLICVNGLALAPNQLDYSVSSTGGTALNHGASLVLQAVNLGAEFHW